MVTVVHGGSARAARARRVLVRQLKRAQATSHERAIPLEVNGRVEERVLKRLVRKEVVRADANGRYWLDLERYAECRRRELIFAIGAILVTLGVMACAMLYGK
jgi:hypothetical protein